MNRPTAAQISANRRAQSIGSIRLDSRGELPGSRRRSEVPAEFRSVEQAPAAPTRYLDAPVRPSTPLPVAQVPATDAQVNFLRTLVRDRAISDEAREHAEQRIARWDAWVTRGRIGDFGLSKSVASAAISKCKEHPFRSQTAPVAPAVSEQPRREVPSPEQLPAGRYAIENAEGELRFYHVWRGTERPTFVKLYVEHGPDSSEVPFKSALSILARLAADPATAARRYGAEIGSCSVCSRRLTNRLSRLLSIGPVCGGRFYVEDDWSAIKESGRERLRAAGLDPKGEVDESDNFDYSADLDI
jgi:hypothetical protein